MNENIFNRRILLVTEIWIQDEDLRFKSIVFDSVQNGKKYIQNWCDCKVPNVVFGETMSHVCGATTLVYEEMEYFDKDNTEFDWDSWGSSGLDSEVGRCEDA
jgi:hypothetical protein